jgi:dihydropteroate synthase
MMKVIGNSGAGAVILHMQGEPTTMNDDPRYKDVAAEVQAFLTRQMAAAMAAGVARETIVIDPGFGFGKTPAHNSELLERLGELRALERPILIGVSAKSFGPKAPTRKPGRIGASLEAAAFAIMRGADIVRVHDVAGSVPFVRALDGRARSPREP